MLRIIERFIALVILVFTLPIFVFIALAILLTSGFPILFKQKRVGKSGKNFLLFKFRTMSKNAQREKISWKRNNPELWQKYCDNNFKLESDSRITKVGKFLRKLSLDELPQLLNIIRGEMSFIGPRPILLREKKTYGKNLKYYQEMVPGISGLWQVSGRSKTSFKERIEYDMKFYEQQNFKTYLLILVKTFFAIFHINKTH